MITPITGVDPLPPADLDEDDGEVPVHECQKCGADIPLNQCKCPKCGAINY